MRKNLIIITLLISLIYNNSFAQRSDNIGAAGAAIAGAAVGLLGGAIQINIIKESLENEAVEWVLENDTLRKFNLKLLQFNATKTSELNNVSSISFIVRPENFDDAYVLMFVCSSGWINDYGLNFSYITPLKFTKEYWGNIILSYLNISSTIKVDDYNKIPTFSRTSKKPTQDDYDAGRAIYVTNITSGGSVSVVNYVKDEETVSLSQILDVDKSKIQFTTKSGTKNFLLRGDLDGDTHIIKDFDDKLMIDFNEENLNIYLKSSSDLFTIKRNKVFEITKKLFCEKCFNEPIL